MGSIFSAVDFSSNKKKLLSVVMCSLNELTKLDFKYRRRFFEASASY